MFCSLMSVFLYFSGFESFAPLERWCDFAKFWCGKKKLVAVYNINVLQQTACLVVNPITAGNFASLFNCTPVGRTSDSMMVPT